MEKALGTRLDQGFPRNIDQTQEIAAAITPTLQTYFEILKTTLLKGLNGGTSITYNTYFLAL